MLNGGLDAIIVRDAPTWHLVAISAVCMGLSLPEGLSVSDNSPRLCII